MKKKRHSLILVNAIGSPLEERLIPAGISPLKMAMSGAHVVVSGAAAAYVWQYKNQASEATESENDIFQVEPQVQQLDRVKTARSKQDSLWFEYNLTP